MVLIFEKASTRTRLSFEIGVAELGGQPLVVNAKDSQLGRGEPLEDTARMLSGYAHAVVYRTFGHERVEMLAAAATIPVINGLSDRFHPCQLLADLQTVHECFGRFDGLRVAWIGDGNNMAQSWILAAKLGGFDLTLSCPPGFEPESELLASASGAVRLLRDPREAASGAHVVTTDVWASMGQEEEQGERAAAFADYQVGVEVMSCALPEAIFLHCLPAHRGEEVTSGVIDGPWSRVWQEAENRLHAQKALLEWLLS